VDSDLYTGKVTPLAAPDERHQPASPVCVPFLRDDLAPSTIYPRSVRVLGAMTW
jgi:hypothetical protein